MNFNEMIKSSDKWNLKVGYYFELEHHLMGFFPALIIKTEEMFICFDKDLMVKIGKLLPPRRFKMNTKLFLTNEEEDIAISIAVLNDVVMYINDNTKHAIDRRSEDITMDIVNEKIFQELINDKEKPFKWAPGLIGSDMSPEEFNETLENALLEGQ